MVCVLVVDDDLSMRFLLRPRLGTGRQDLAAANQRLQVAELRVEDLPSSVEQLKHLRVSDVIVDAGTRLSSADNLPHTQDRKLLRNAG